MGLSGVFDWVSNMFLLTMRSGADLNCEYLRIRKRLSTQIFSFTMSTICIVSVLAFFLTVNQALQSTNKDFLEDTVWVCWSRGVKNWDKLNALVKTHLLKYMLEGHVHCAFSVQYQNTKVYITSHAFVYFTGWRNQCKEWDQFQRLLFERSPEKQELIAVLWFNWHPVLTGLPPPPQYFLGTLLVQWIVTVVFRNLPCYFPQVTNYAPPPHHHNHPYYIMQTKVSPGLWYHQKLWPNGINFWVWQYTPCMK